MVDFSICQVNNGAISFLSEAYSPIRGWPEIAKAEIAFQRMYNNDIKGVLLYILWNDCCDRNTDKALRIMRDNSIEDILKHINAAGGRGIPYGEAD